jgi:hypothetical protein
MRARGRVQNGHAVDVEGQLDDEDVAEQPA